MYQTNIMSNVINQNRAEVAAKALDIAHLIGDSLDYLASIAAPMTIENQYVVVSKKMVNSGFYFLKVTYLNHSSFKVH